MRPQRWLAIRAAAYLVFWLAVALGASSADRLAVTSIESIGMTVSNMDRAVDFYTSVLSFERVSDVELAGRDHELLAGVFGARLRVVRLRLGDESLELTEFLTPKGRPVPDDMRPNDRAFQHVAIIVRDMDEAYARLRRFQVAHASTGPQELPAWNSNAGGISAFYFRDPDRHFLEILHFPADKGLAKWHATDRLFLGIDHTAMVVGDTNISLRFFRDTLGLQVAGESENYATEQEHLNNVFGARLRITSLRSPKGPGIELLEYLAPGNGRPVPADLQSNDIAHWQTTLVVDRLDPLLALARDHRIALTSPGPVDVGASHVGFRIGALTRDPDGHAMRLVGGEQ